MGKGDTILFVNPNRFTAPPAIPVGIEYLVHSLRDNGMDAEVVDLCFSEDPTGILEKALQDQRPDVVCFTVRNNDSVLYPDTEYFLPEIKNYVSVVKERSTAYVIVGGSALTADPEGIVEYLEADLAITGPGEHTLPDVLRHRASIQEGEKVIRGDMSGCRNTVWKFRPDRANVIDYGPYVERGGITGFETHKGCSSNCIYCLEARSPVTFRDRGDVLFELTQISHKGYNDLHLCDSEFNEDLEYCRKLLTLVITEDIGIKWALYMKPGTFDATLFELLKGSGAYLITLTVDTFRRSHSYWKHIGDMIGLAHAHDIRISIDLLSGFPFEGIDACKQALEYLRKLEPHEVVINTWLRLYKHLPVTKTIERHDDLMEHVINRKDRSYLSPVFYNHIHLTKLKEMIGGDPLFRIAGEEQTVNYQKA